MFSLLCKRFYKRGEVISRAKVLNHISQISYFLSYYFDYPKHSGLCVLSNFN